MSQLRESDLPGSIPPARLIYLGVSKESQHASLGLKFLHL